MSVNNLPKTLQNASTRVEGIAKNHFWVSSKGTDGCRDNWNEWKYSVAPVAHFRRLTGKAFCWFSWCKTCNFFFLNYFQSSGYSSGQQPVTSNSPPCMLMPIQVSFSVKISCLMTILNFYLFVTQINLAYQKANVFFNYLTSCHDLWEQADSLILRGNHIGELRSQRF